MRTIAVCNQKGGVGKTTTTINLGTALARAGKRVLLIDMDPQGQLGIGLGIDVANLTSTVGQVLERRGGLLDALHSTPQEGMQICPSNAQLAQVEKGLHQRRARELLLQKCIGGVSGFEFCLIDTPPSVGLLTENALCAAREIIIPTTPSYYALEGTFGLLEMTASIGEELGHAVEILAVLLTQYDPRTRITREIENQLQEFFDSKLTKSRIRINTKLNEAQMHHLPIFQYAPRSRGAFDYQAAAEEIFGVRPSDVLGR